SGVVGTPTTCPQCHGAGHLTQSTGGMKFNIPCPRCGGTGKIHPPGPGFPGESGGERPEPPGGRVKAGTRAGPPRPLGRQGNAGTHGASAGDLYIIIRVGEHPVFHREADDIHVTVPVEAWEAALGAKIEVPTIDGRSQLKIPPGTQSGQKLRLREKGVPSATREGARGDEIVEIKIYVPAAHDLRARELWQELQKLHPEDPRAELWSKAS